MTRHPPPPAFRRQADGCTGVPDSIHGIPVRDICDEHDWDYHAVQNGVYLSAKVPPEHDHGLIWDGAGCYVPIARDPDEHVLPATTWVRYGDRARSRSRADSVFASATWGRLKANRRSARGLWGRLMALTPQTWWVWTLICASWRLLGVRWLGKWEGVSRWTVVTLTLAFLGVFMATLVRRFT